MSREPRRGMATRWLSVLVVLALALALTPGRAAAPTTQPQKDDAAELMETGLEAYRAGEYSQALTCFDQALALYRLTSDRGGEARCLYELGTCYHSLGEHQRGIDCYDQALALFRQTFDLQDQAACLRATATCYFDLGNCRRAIGCSEESLLLYKEIGDPAGKAAAWDRLCLYHTYLGNYSVAIDYCQEALAVYRRLGDRQGAGRCLESLGLCYYWLGDYERAKPYFMDALCIFREVGDRNGEASSLNNIGYSWLVVDGSQPPKECLALKSALDCHEQALAISREVGDRSEEARSLSALGDSCRSLAAYGLAVEYYGQARRIYEAIGDRDGLAWTLLNIGRCRCAMEEYHEAIRWYDLCLESLRLPTGSTNDLELSWRVRDGLGESHHGLGELPPAVADWQEAVGGIEQMRVRVGRTELVRSFMRNKLRVYGSLVPALLEIGAPDQGASYAERAKARTFVDMMETAMRLSPNVLPSVLQTASKVLQVLSGLTETGQRSAPQGVGGGTTRSGAESAAQLTRAEYDAFMAELTRQTPALGQPLAVTAEQLQRYCREVTDRLARGTIVLEYFVTDEETILWVITEGGIQTASRIAVSRSALTSRVRSCRQVVQSAPAPGETMVAERQVRELGAALYDLLITPVEEYLTEGAHLVIIPSDVLFYLPFAALYRCPGCQGRSLLGGQYLVEGFTLSYAPSVASLYWPLQHEGDGTYSSILSVGNPTGDLLAAQKEARTVAELFPYATTLIGQEGTEAALKRALREGQYDVLHFATHGRFNEKMPMASEVRFREGAGEDGHLFAGELLELFAPGGASIPLSPLPTGQAPEGSALAAELSDWLALAEQRADQEVIVAVVGSGISTTVPELAPRIWHNEDEIPGNGQDDDGNGYVDDITGWDFRDGDADSLAGSPIHWQGTFVAGIISGALDLYKSLDEERRVRIMDVRFLDSHNMFSSTDWSTLIQAVEYAVDNGADLIYLGFWAQGRPPSTFARCIETAAEKGVLFVAPVGNLGTDEVSYPARYPAVIGVGATTPGGAVAEFSNRGKDVDVYAQGAAVESLLPNGWTAVRSGTSLAAAAVARQLALALLQPGAGSEERGSGPGTGAVQAGPRLPPELVVMSACQTALPPEVSQDLVVGDEIQGLGQCLFVAGVPSALLTLWNVNDLSTSELMIQFYQNLMSGQAKGEALAEAQRALLKGDYGLPYCHPYYWAPFVMYGDWR